MLDKSVPHISVAMVNHDATNYPAFHLPADILFVSIKKDWKKIGVDCNQKPVKFPLWKVFALVLKRNLEMKEKLAKRFVFVQAPNGELIGTAMLWDGDTFGEMASRIHWVAVLDSHGGKGIAKALLSKILGINKNDFVYLTTQTGSYQAIYLYQKFGFEKYIGKTPEKWKTADFQDENETAWQIIENKIAEHQAQLENFQPSAIHVIIKKTSKQKPVHS